MLGKIVSVLAGQQLARTVGGAAAGPLGAVAGLALPMLTRRMGPMGMIGMAAAAWAVSRVAGQRKAASVAAPPVPVPTKPIPMVVAD